MGMRCQVHALLAEGRAGARKCSGGADVASEGISRRAGGYRDQRNTGYLNERLGMYHRLFWTTRASVFVILFVSQNACAGPLVSWQASSGNTPDQIANAWTLVDTANPEMPVLVNGVLTLSTSQQAESMYYDQRAPLLDTSSPFFIETRVRYVSGSTELPSRAPITILFTTARNVGNALFIEHDRVFFNTQNITAGPKVSVDTNDVFHTYRINYDGSGGLTLLYDGRTILTGSTFNSALFNGETPRILWGEFSGAAYGVSEWQYFAHNAAIAVPEPSSIAMCVVLFGGAPILCRARCRNPGWLK